MKKYDKEVEISIKAINEALILMNSLNFKKPIKMTKISINDEKEDVTNIDIRVNLLIASIISKYFPNDIIFGEEHSYKPKSNSSKRIWLIDPIDGTRSLIDKVEGYPIMISLLFNFKPIIGIIGDVRTEDIFVAIRGQGIYKIKNQILHEFTPNEFIDYNLLWNPYSENMLRHRRLKHNIIEKLQLKGVIEVESCGLRALHLAKKEGVLLLSLQNSAKYWDTAAGEVFIHEIGGVYTDLKGKELSYTNKRFVHENGAIATLDISHDEAIKYISSCLKSAICYS